MAVEPGHYEFFGDNPVFTRVGDAKPMIRYRGVTMPSGEIMNFERNEDASMYTADNISMAMAYTEKDNVEIMSREHGLDNAVGQLYVLSIEPRASLDMMDIHDEVRIGDIPHNISDFDVIDMLGGAGPESIIRDPGMVNVEAVYEVDWDTEEMNKIFPEHHTPEMDTHVQEGFRETRRHSAVVGMASVVSSATGKKWRPKNAADYSKYLHRYEENKRPGEETPEYINELADIFLDVESGKTSIEHHQDQFRSVVDDIINYIYRENASIRNIENPEPYLDESRRLAADDGKELGYSNTTRSDRPYK